MIWVDDKQVKVEHFPDGTQRISIPGVREIAPFAATILWKYDDESELSTLIYITRHLKNECQIIHILQCHIFRMLEWIVFMRVQNVLL